MATVNLGRVKPVNKGTWSSATTYAIDDFVQYTDSGVLSTYIAVAASTNETPSTSGTENGTYWKYMSKGTSLAVGNNKVVVSDGSGNLTGQTIGTAGQVLKVNSGANGFVFGGAGTYSLGAHDSYTYGVPTVYNGNDNYHDIAGGNTVNFTPKHANDIIFFSYICQVYTGSGNQGDEVYLNLGTSSNLSEATKIDYQGQHSWYQPNGSFHHTISKTVLYPISVNSLQVGTTYYVEIAGATHGANNVSFNHGNSAQSGQCGQHLAMLHYEYNA